MQMVTGTGNIAPPLVEPTVAMIDFADYPASSNLRRVLAVRSALFVALTALVATVHLDLPRAPLAAIVGALAAFTFASWLRVARVAQPVRDGEVAAQLVVDVVALTGGFYFCGGWTNPLVSLYLVPIAAGAVMLPRAMAWLVAFAATVGYATIAAAFVPLPHRHGPDAPAATFATHVLGMGLTFVVAAGLIAYLGTTMAASLRARAAALAHAREEILRNEQIIGVATLAAGTAHELSTPLNTIAVIASEMRDTAPSARDVDVLLAQIDICKDILRRLRAEAASPGDDLQAIGTFVDGVAEQFQLLRPAAHVAFRRSGHAPEPLIRAEPTLKQAILNLLNNAADASPGSVDVAAKWTADRLVLDILDRGAGFANVHGIEQPFAADAANDSAEGMGMGLILANATIERLGGAVHIADRSGGGAWVQVIVPLTARVA
jgi:two-component system sensor histidine kinase RegB